MKGLKVFYVLWHLSVYFILPKVSSAHDSTRDSCLIKVDIIDHNEYDYIVPSETQSGIIPFTLAGNLIIIQANVDTVSGNFILDTGAPGLILNLTYFRNYKASNHMDEDGGGITGGTVGGSSTIVKKLNFGNFSYAQVNADRVSLGHIENAKGIKILGLLGSGLFKRFELMIDYENEVIHFHRMSKQGKAGNGGFYIDQKNAFQVIPMLFRDGKIIIRLSVKGKKLNFILDTGAESNVLDSRLSKEIFNEVIMDRKITLVGSGSKKVDAWYGRLKELEIAPVKLLNMEVLITSMEYMSKSFDRNIDGMLGFPFLSKQKIGINFLTNELYIWK